MNAAPAYTAELTKASVRATGGSADELDAATQRWLDAALAELMSAPLTSAQFDLIRRTFGEVDVNSP